MLVKEAPDQVQHQAQPPHSRGHQSVQHDHSMDNILGNIQRELKFLIGFESNN